MSDLVSKMQILSLEYERELQKASRKSGTKESLDGYVQAAMKQYELSQLTSGEASERHKNEMLRLMRQVRDDIETYKIAVTPEVIKNLGAFGVTVKEQTSAVPLNTMRSVPTAEVKTSRAKEPTDSKEESKNKNLYGFNVDEIRLTSVPDATFEEFGNLNDTIGAIVDCLKTANLKRLYPKLSEQMSERRQNILLYGPPGGGKTHFCKAIGNYVMRNFEGGVFFLVMASQIKHSLVNVAESRLNALFEEANKYEMPVVCIDEIDALFPDRDKTSAEYVNSFVTEFLQHIDGVGGKTKAVIIGATNYPWMIDKGVRSRMPITAYVGLPDREHMEDFLRKKLSRFLGDDEKYAEEIVQLCIDKLKNASYRVLESVWLQVETASFNKTVKACPENTQVETFQPVSREEVEAILARIKIDNDPAYISKLMDVEHWDEN